ncbi:MAG: hypothetical protein IPI84_01620 [Holophagaceae bacterium]|nr:hypothetical protein [Holophagaceae bacterium]
MAESGQAVAQGIEAGLRDLFLEEVRAYRSRSCRTGLAPLPHLADMARAWSAG